MKTKSRLKYEVATAAGMSQTTFRRWMKQHQPVLQRFGVTPTTKLLTPKAVKYICSELGIHEEDF